MKPPRFLGLVEARTFNAINLERPAWKVTTADDLRDYADHQVIEAGKAAGFYPKSVMKALHGLLNKRNESAHPSEYFPDFNETLGYVSELFQRIAYLMGKSTTYVRTSADPG